MFRSDDIDLDNLLVPPNPWLLLMNAERIVRIETCADNFMIGLIGNYKIETVMVDSI